MEKRIFLKQLPWKKGIYIYLCCSLCSSLWYWSGKTGQLSWRTGTAHWTFPGRGLSFLTCASEPRLSTPDRSPVSRCLINQPLLLKTMVPSHHLQLPLLSPFLWRGSEIKGLVHACWNFAGFWGRKSLLLGANNITETKIMGLSCQSHLPRQLNVQHNSLIHFHQSVNPA